MPNVRVKENEPFEVALRRFKRGCEKAGILLKYVAASFMRSRPPSASAKLPLR